MSPFLPARYPVTSAIGDIDPDIFPDLAGQSFLVSKRPIWSTTIASSSSGRERRKSLWSYPKWAFKVSYEVLRDRPDLPELAMLLAFFNLQAGRGAEFGFLDPGDNTVEGERFGTGDGTTTTFRLTRTLRVGSVSAQEPIGRVLNIPTVFVDSAPVAAFTVGAGGTITFATAPAAGAALTWTGRFMFNVRFDQDDLDCEQMMARLWSQSGLALMSVKR